MRDQQAFFTHFPKTVSQAIVDYAEDVVFLGSRYLFVRRVGLFYWGYCTHCKREYLLDKKPKHNSSEACVHCESLVIAKDAWRGRGKLIDRAYFVYFEKSVINPEAFVARGLYVIRDYRDDYYKVETQFLDVASYLFEPGRARMMRRSYWGTRWEERRRITSEGKTSMRHVRCHVSRESVFQAVRGSKHFQYSQWEQFSEDDLIYYFELAAKYPCVEFLVKLGLRGIINSKLWGEDMYKVINWRGKTPEKILRLSKAEIRELRKTGPYGPRALAFYHRQKEKGIGLSLPQARELAEVSDGYYFSVLKDLTVHGSEKELYRYFLKQLNAQPRRFSNASSVLTAWRDYLNDCRELGKDLTKPHIVFPNNLYTAHQESLQKVKLKKDTALNAKIAARLPELKMFAFVKNGLLVRPVESLAELFAEGKTLQHCVGSYAQRYADGDTTIFVIRRAAEPDMPFYTLEYAQGAIRQCRGLKNCDLTPEVAAFVEAFKAAKFSKKPKKRKPKEKVAQPA